MRGVEGGWASETDDLVQILLCGVCKPPYAKWGAQHLSQRAAGRTLELVRVKGLALCWERKACWFWAGYYHQSTVHEGPGHISCVLMPRSLWTWPQRGRGAGLAGPRGRGADAQEPLTRGTEQPQPRTPPCRAGGSADPSRRKGAAVTGNGDCVSSTAQPPAAEALWAGRQPSLGRGGGSVQPCCRPDSGLVRRLDWAGGTLSKLLHLEGEGRGAPKGMGARGRGLWGPFSRPPTTPVPWGLGHPQTLPEFRALVTPGWGHPEPAPSLPGGVSVSPREPVRSVLPHEVTEDRPLSWSPSTAEAPPGALPQPHPRGCPTGPGLAPRARGRCRRWGRLPGLSLDVGAGRLSSLLGVGRLAGRCAPCRAQRQEGI